MLTSSEDRLTAPVGRRLCALAIVCAAVLTVGALNLTNVSSPSLRSTVETSTAIVWLIAVALLAQAFNETRQLRLLAVLFGIVVLGTVDVVSTFAPAALGQTTPAALAAAPALAIPIGSLCMLWAARLSKRVLLRRGSLFEQAGLLLALLAAGVAGLLSWLWADAQTENSGHVGLFALPLAAAAGLLLVTAVTFLKHSHSDAASTTGYFSAAALLLGAGALKRIFVADTAGLVAQSPIFRLAAFSLIAIGAFHVLAERRGELRRAAAAMERERLARDLHDGLCQDLAFISASARRIVGEAEAEPILFAARRALAASRGLLADLSAGHAGDLQSALRAIADELALRFGISVEVDVEVDAAGLAQADNEHLTRIVREAVVNAATHGEARNVVIQLRPDADERLVLRVIDDGCGLPDEVRREGFGMRTMRRRALNMGARFEAGSGPDGGAEVKVLWQ